MHEYLPQILFEINVFEIFSSLQCNCRVCMHAAWSPLELPTPFEKIKKHHFFRILEYSACSIAIDFFLYEVDDVMWRN